MTPIQDWQQKWINTLIEKAYLICNGVFETEGMLLENLERTLYPNEQDPVLTYDPFVGGIRQSQVREFIKNKNVTADETSAIRLGEFSPECVKQSIAYISGIPIELEQQASKPPSSEGSGSASKMKDRAIAYVSDILIDIGNSEALANQAQVIDYVSGVPSNFDSSGNPIDTDNPDALLGRMVIIERSPDAPDYEEHF